MSWIMSCILNLMSQFNMYLYKIELYILSNILKNLAKLIINVYPPSNLCLPITSLQYLFLSAAHAFMNCGLGMWNENLNSVIAKMEWIIVVLWANYNHCYWCTLIVSIHLLRLSIIRTEGPFCKPFEPPSHSYSIFIFDPKIPLA